MISEIGQNPAVNRQFNMIKQVADEKAQSLKSTLGALAKDLAGIKTLLETRPAGKQEFDKFASLLANAKSEIGLAQKELGAYVANDSSLAETLAKCKKILEYVGVKIEQLDITRARDIGEASEMANSLSSTAKDGQVYSFVGTLDLMSRAFSEIESAIPQAEETKPSSGGISKDILKSQIVKTGLGAVFEISNSIKNDYFAYEKFQKTLALAAGFEARFNVTLEDFEKNTGNYSQDREMIEAYRALLGSAINLIPATQDMKLYEKQAGALKGSLHALIENSKSGKSSLDSQTAGKVMAELEKNYSKEVSKSVLGMMTDTGLMGLSKNDIFSPETFSKNVQTGTGKVRKRGKLVEVPRYGRVFDMSQEVFQTGIETAVVRKSLRNMGFFEADLDDIVSGRKSGSRIVKDSQMKNFVNEDLKAWKPFDSEGGMQSMTLNSLIWERIPKAVQGAVSAAEFMEKQGSLNIRMPYGTGDKVFDTALYLIAIGITETGLSQGMVSTAGAVGVYQILPSSADSAITNNPGLKDRISTVKKNGRRTLNLKNVLTSYSNAPFVAAGHLADEQEYFSGQGSKYADDWRSLAAGYNAGPKGGTREGRISGIDWEDKSSKNMLPGETQDYVVMVSMYARALAKDPKFVELLKTEMKKQGIEFKGAAQ